MSVVIVLFRLPMNWDQQLVRTRGWWTTPTYENISCRICPFRNILPRPLETLVVLRVQVYDFADGVYWE